MKGWKNKYQYYFKGIFWIFLLPFLLSACDDMKDQPHITDLPTDGGISQILVLSEGLFNMNNSTLANYDFYSQVMTTDYFLSVNKRGLGDTANDMERYGGKLYIVVSGSSQVEVVNFQTGKSIRQIQLFNKNGVGREPREITFAGNSAYVCCYDGTLAKIDTTTLKITGEVTCGSNPDGICFANGKIYVSNSGGLNFPNYDNTVSVVDTATFTEQKKITVLVNPSKLQSDSEGDVFLISKGNYGSTQPALQKINSTTDELEETYDSIPATNICVHNDTAYLYNYDYTTNTSVVKLFDCRQNKIVNNDFISDTTKIEAPYSIDINPVNGDVYICDAKTYTVWGDVLCFDRSGKLKFRIREIGLNPDKVIFKK